MKYKMYSVMMGMLLLSLQSGAQTKTTPADSLKREDSLRKERAARADVYVSGKNIISAEPVTTPPKKAVSCKRKTCRKHGH